MGIVPCPLTCHNSEKESQSLSNHLHSESTSLSSQSSLPSVPSLTSQFQQDDQQSSNTHQHCISTLKAHSSHVFSLAISENFLYSGSSNKEIRVWSRDQQSAWAHDMAPNNIVAIGDGAVKSLVVSGYKLISAHQDHKIRVWRIHPDDGTNHRRYKLLATLPTLSDRVLRFLPPKNHVQVRRHKKCTWVHHVDTISALSLSKDSSLLYSVSWDRSIKIWRTSDFRCLESVAGAHDDAINALALSNDGYVYTGSADNKIKVWRKHPGDRKHSLVDTLEEHKSAVNALALSTDGSVLYSGACDRSIVVWEKDGRIEEGGGHMVVVGALRGHTRAILCLAVVADLICSGSADRTVRIWRRGVVRRYSCLTVLEGHTGPVKCLATAIDKNDSSCCSNHSSSSPSSSYLVYSGSLDCYVKVWRISVSGF